MEQSSGKRQFSWGLQLDGSSAQFTPHLNAPMGAGEALRCARLRSTSRILALIAGLVGFAVLVGGWMLDFSFMRPVIPGAANMKVNTALGLMIAASAILLDARRSGAFK